MDKLEDGWNGCHLPLVLFTSFPEIGNTHRVVIEYRRRGGHSLQAGGGADKEQKKVNCEDSLRGHYYSTYFQVSWLPDDQQHRAQVDL